MGNDKILPYKKSQHQHLREGFRSCLVVDPWLWEKELQNHQWFLRSDANNQETEEHPTDHHSADNADCDQNLARSTPLGWNQTRSMKEFVNLMIGRGYLLKTLMFSMSLLTSRKSPWKLELYPSQTSQLASGVKKNICKWHHKVLAGPMVEVQKRFTRCFPREISECGQSTVSFMLPSHPSSKKNTQNLCCKINMILRIV